MKDGICPKCGGRSVVPNLEVTDRVGGAGVGADTVLSLDNRPCGFLSRTTRSTLIRAWMCSDCGYVELYAAKPATILKYFQYLQGRRDASSK